MHIWSWAYTIIATLVLLVPFLLCCAVLLLRSRRRGYRTRGKYVPTPQSVATPLGHWWDEETQELAAPGIERARNRQYATKGKF